jgi:hypothetical protein
VAVGYYDDPYGYGQYYDPDPYGQPNPYAPNAPTGGVPPTETAPVPGPTPTPPTTPPETPPTPTPTPTPAPTPTPYSDQAFRQIMLKYPPTSEGIRQAVAEANRTFGTNITIFGSTGGKLTLPDGRRIDPVIGLGTGHGQWGWQDITNGGGDGGGGGFDPTGGGLDPGLLTPWTGTPPARGPNVDFHAPEDFVAPTAASILEDPSYQFRVGEGQRVLENSAAARGTLNSGGTLEDILNYGQRAASQEYSNVWDRMFGLWNARWNNALNQFRTASDVDNEAYRRAWNAYTDAKDTHFRNQSEPFDKLYKVATLGAGAAG